MSELRVKSGYSKCPNSPGYSAECQRHEVMKSVQGRVKKAGSKFQIRHLKYEKCRSFQLLNSSRARAQMCKRQKKKKIAIFSQQPRGLALFFCLLNFKLTLVNSVYIGVLDINLT